MVCSTTLQVSLAIGQPLHNETEYDAEGEFSLTSADHSEAPNEIREQASNESGYGDREDDLVEQAHNDSQEDSRVQEFIEGIDHLPLDLSVLESDQNLDVFGFEKDDDPKDGLTEKEISEFDQELKALADSSNSKKSRKKAKQTSKNAERALAQKISKLFKKYQSSRKVERLVKESLKRIKASDASKKLCYRYVKKALYDSGMVPKQKLTGGKAILGVRELKRYGFTNLLECPRWKTKIKNPMDAPKGAVLVYKSTEKKNAPGHIEIKTSRPGKWGFVSDFRRKYDFRKAKGVSVRKLVGVMVQVSSKDTLCKSTSKDAI